MCQHPDTTDSVFKEQTLHVGHAIRERRIDKYLHSRFGDLSRSYIQDAIKSGNVKVNGKAVKPSFKLSAGDKIELTIPEPPSYQIPPEDIPLNIIYEDSDLIIINKPANMIVHPARGNTHGTLVNALVFYSEELSSGIKAQRHKGTKAQNELRIENETQNSKLKTIEESFRPGIVHRLDRDTTGVMVVAKNDIAQWKIARQFEHRQVKKTYLAVVHGTPSLSADRINAPLGVHPKIREKYAIRPETGRQAVTQYEVLEEFRGFSLLVLTPTTGRTHQIRVHLSYIKHPIVADQMYNGKLVYLWQLQAPDPVGGQPAPQEPVIKRCALHASTLEFKHPTTNQIVRFDAPLPEDMQTLIDLLRKYRKTL